MSTLILPLADQTTHDLTDAVLALRSAMMDMTHTQTQLMDKLDRFVTDGAQFATPNCGVLAINYRH